MSIARSAKPPDGTLIQPGAVPNSNKGAVLSHEMRPGSGPTALLTGPRAMQQSELDDYQYSGERPWRDEEILRELTIDEELPRREIGELLGCSHQTVGRWQDKFGLSDTDATEPWQEEETLRRLYSEERMTQEEMAEHLGVEPSTIARWLERHDIERRGLEWINMKPYAGYRTGNRGHEVWYSGSQKLDNRAPVLVHRLAAVAWFGWGAVEDKVIHHENGIPWDNRESNLMTMTDSEHSSHHANERWGRNPSGWSKE